MSLYAFNINYKSFSIQFFSMLRVIFSLNTTLRCVCKHMALEEFVANMCIIAGVVSKIWYSITFTIHL